MDKRVYEASLRGDEETLRALIEEDQLILERTNNVTSSQETPLHIAALRGHLNFAKALLTLKPKLTSEVDASGCSPLHLASAQGHADIVRELLPLSGDVYDVRDYCGRTALHLAVVKGRLDVVKELVRAHPEMATQRWDGGESVIHLCVKYSRLEALKLVMGLVKDEKVVAWRDDDGNTVLHFAAIFKQLEALRYLVYLPGVKAIANDKNNNGYTALDASEKCPLDFETLEIQEILIQLQTRDRDLATTTTTTITIDSPNEPISPPAKKSWIKKSFYKCVHFLTEQSDTTGNEFGNLMVVATVIATMSFQAAVAPPGGLWQEDTTRGPYCSADNVCAAGTAVLAYVYPTSYSYFVSCNTMSFIASLCVILLHFAGFPLKNKMGTWLVTLSMCITLNTVMSAYTLASAMMTPEGITSPALRYVERCWTVLLCFSLVTHTVRLAYWLVFKIVTPYVGPRSICIRQTWMRVVAALVLAGVGCVALLVFVSFLASSYFTAKQIDAP